MNMPTQAQINAGLRYAGTWVVAGGGALVMLGAIPPDKAHALVDALQGVLTDLQDMVGRFYVIAGIVGPGLAFWLAKAGVKSASPQAQIAAVQALPQAQVTVTDPKLAEGIPGVQVAPAAKAVLAIFAVMLAATLYDGGTSLAFAQSTRAAPKTAPTVETPSDCLPLDPRPACKNGVFSPNAPITIASGNSTASLSALWAKIIDKDLPTDLTYAKALADNAATPGSKLRSACYAALLTANQQANGSGLTSGSAPLTEPPAPANVFSELEKAAQVIDNLQPTSPVVSGCAPAAQVLKMDVLNFISTVVSGAAIKTLTAGVLP